MTLLFYFEAIRVMNVPFVPVNIHNVNQEQDHRGEQVAGEQRELVGPTI
jgi:hypothetical protein